MGKKRRMLSSTKKFAKKHSRHPRMRMLNSIKTTVAPPTAEATTPVVESPASSAPEPVKTVPEFATTAVAPAKIAKEVAPQVEPPPAIVETVVKTETDSVAPKKAKLTAPKKSAPKTTKKTTTRRRKTTKKKTNTANA